MLTSIATLELVSVFLAVVAMYVAVEWLKGNLKAEVLRQRVDGFWSKYKSKTNADIKSNTAKSVSDFTPGGHATSNSPSNNKSGSVQQDAIVKANPKLNLLDHRVVAKATSEALAGPVNNAVMLNNGIVPGKTADKPVKRNW